MGRILVRSLTAQDTLVSGGPLLLATITRGKERETVREKERGKGREKETGEEMDMKDMSSGTTINALHLKDTILSLPRPMGIIRNQDVHRPTTEAMNMRDMSWATLKEESCLLEM